MVVPWSSLSPCRGFFLKGPTFLGLVVSWPLLVGFHSSPLLVEVLSPILRARVGCTRRWRLGGRGDVWL